ncbi:hypothetical protein [Ramlibacter tataouinensis]|uniref:Lipoprotein n=1 Tax=Ramlibacter tataouinensis (strain ATCC BAA-407 / DSM 14655 / LMG 21543 / TTB310) TaxID=365046 RepID=F5XZW1_RAMTT|nr:hypothetical protein [Ramlibacter tataouinensis]AEG93322.1 Conserved hypothetical protein [Ramlibacter tataouinensis TTB310]
MKHLHTRLLGAAVLSTLVGALAACGGGGDDTPPPAANVAGLWTGITSNGRAVIALTFQSGSTWALYSVLGNPGVIGGAVQANGSVSGRTINGGPDARDFSLEAGVVSPVTLTATVNPRQSISGSVSGSSTGTFSGSYNTAFDQTPSLATVTGVYAGSGTVGGGSEPASVALAADGTLSGSSSSGCTYAGTVTPRTDGNAYNVSVIFGGGVCALGSATVNGVAIYDSGARRLYAAALNGNRTDGFLFLGTKP